MPDPAYKNLEFCIFCKEWFPKPILENHDKEACRGLMPDYDSTPMNEPWPPPPVSDFDHSHQVKYLGKPGVFEPDAFTNYPGLLLVLTVSALIAGGFIGAFLGVILSG